MYSVTLLALLYMPGISILTHQPLTFLKDVCNSFKQPLTNVTYVPFKWPDCSWPGQYLIHFIGLAVVGKVDGILPPHGGAKTH